MSEKPKIVREKLNRFERIIFDTLNVWQLNLHVSWKDEGNETFDLDELMQVISEYGPWTNLERELPTSATENVLRWFVEEGIIRKLGDESWEILL